MLTGSPRLSATCSATPSNTPSAAARLPSRRAGIAKATGCRRDTGPGIAATEQERIFEPFHRGGAHLLYPEGMGLGLAITRDIVAAHGGRLTLESVPGQGSTFT